MLNRIRISLEFIVEEASKIEDLYERLKFFKHRKLEYEVEAEKLDFDIGLGDKIQIEIEVLEKLISNSTSVFKNKIADKTIVTKVEEFIKRGETNKAINFLIDDCFIESMSIKHQIILLSNQWSELERKLSLCLIKEPEAEGSKARISKAILEISTSLVP